LSASTHRRDFLKQSALAGAGAWTIGRDLFAKDQSPNEKLQVAIIGANGQGGGNLNNLARIDGVRIVGLCDIDDHRLAEPAKKFPEVKTYNDFRKMLEENAKGIDAVVVSTPDHTHAVATVMALKMGKHVYCEKPLTHSVHEARVVAKAAAEAKVATQMGNAGHSSDAYRRVVELIRAGAIGPVREVHTWTNRPIWAQGQGRPKDRPDCPDFIHWDLWLGPAPERPYHPAYHPFSWRGWWDFGTGALGDMACHIMDPAFWALKLGYPRLIEAGSPPINPESPPKWSIIRYEFPERDGMPPVTLYWYDGGRLPPWELWEGERLNKDGGVIFVGEKGKRLLVGHVSTPKLLPEKDFQDFQPPEKTIPRSIGHHAEWVKACKDGGETGTNFAYAAALTETVLLGNVALRAGKALEYDGDAMRITNDTDANHYLQREYRKGWSLG
jgi:hypothetical protein